MNSFFVFHHSTNNINILIMGATQSKDQLIYSEQHIVYNEQPFLIEGDQLKHILHRSVVAMTFLNANRRINAGSGVLISKDTILTAAHNIFDKGCKAENSKFKIYIRANGVGEEYHQIENVRYPQQFKTCKLSAKLSFDYAIMKLKKPVEFNKFLPLSIACKECLFLFQSEKQLEIYGFPCAYPREVGDLQTKSFKGNFESLDQYGTKIRLHQYGLARNERIAAVDDLKICYGISTLPGQSGCPVVLQGHIIAVHVGGEKGKFNIGRNIDSSLIINFCKWRQEMRAAPFSLRYQDVCPHVEQMLVKMKFKLTFQISSPKSMKLSNYNYLLDLVISGNDLWYFDVSSCPHLLRLNLSYNKLRTINITKNISLTQVYLQFNEIQQIDVSSNINLTFVSLSSNKLKKIDLRNNINIKSLKLSWNKLQQIDVSAISKLTYLALEDNQLSKIDVSVNYYLNWLDLSKNKLLLVNIAKNINLAILDLSQNKLSDIDVGKNVKITELYLNSNQLQKIDVKNNINLTLLSLWDNQLQKIDLSFNTELKNLNLSANKLLTIDLSANTNIAWLNLSKNELKSIDLTKNINLQKIYLWDNKFSNIDLSANIKLDHLDIHNNLLQFIDVTANSRLSWIILYSNKIKQIDLSTNTKLNRIWLYKNRLTLISLAITKNVPKEDYNIYQYFDFSDQESDQCKVQMKCDVSAEVQERALLISRLWKVRYSDEKSNQHKCAYSFKIL